MESVTTNKRAAPSTTQTPSERKTHTKKSLSAKSRQAKRDSDRRRSVTRVNIGGAFSAWRDLRLLLGIKSDPELAAILLESYEKWRAMILNIQVGSISDCCNKEKPGDLDLTGGLEITMTTNMSHEDGTTGITMDVSEITVATNEDRNISNEEEHEEEEDEAEDDCDETVEGGGEFDSDPEWGKDHLSRSEHSDSNQLEKGGSDEMKGHSEVHKRVGELCPDCGAFFTLDKIHTCEYKMKQFPCNVCGKSYKDEAALKNHSRIHSEDYQHFCKFCLAPFTTRLDKLAHQRDHTPNKKPYLCPYCAMTFSKLCIRNLHLKRHRGPSSVSCPHCDLLFPTADGIKRHMLVHTSESQFVCQFCSRSFSHLTSHLHTGDKPYQCQHCDKRFDHNESLKYHVMRYHKGASDWRPRERSKEMMERIEPPAPKMNESHEDGSTGITFDISEITYATDEDSNCSNEEEDEEEEDEDEEEEDEEEEDDSDLSGSEISGSSQLEKRGLAERKAHYEARKGVGELCPDCGAFFTVGKTHTCEYKMKPFPCNVCGKRCKDEAALKCHSRIHNEDYQHLCKFCLAPFKTRLHKLVHQRAHTRKKKPYSCPDCPLKFSKLRVRNLHLEGHRGPKSFACPHCDLVFQTANRIKRHMLVHTGERPFVCQVCRLSFKQAGHLKSHLRLHTGEKPYQCQHCDKSFNHNVSLKSHVMRYHKGVSDLGPREHSKERMERIEPPIPKIDEVNEMSTPEDVIAQDPKLQEEPKKRIKSGYRSTGRPKGRPKRNAATGMTDAIAAVQGEALEPITAAEPSEDGRPKRVSSTSIGRDWSDRDPTSELEEEDKAEESKGVRKSKRKASQRPKTFETADKDFDSDSDFDPAEDKAKRRRTSWQKSGSVGGRRGRPRNNRLV